MRWIDGHLDLAYLAVCGRDLRAPCPPEGHGCVDLPALREAGVDIAFGTIFTEPDASRAAGPFTYPDSSDLDAAERAGRRQLEVYETLARDGEIRLVRGFDEFDAAAPTPGLVLLMEGADPIRDASRASWWVERGVRLVGLTWAAGTRYAGGNARPGPLTPAGRDLVAALDALGVIHDVSHLADESFDGLLAHARGPVVATHSNCRALLDGKNQRHLTDEQIGAVGARGGIVGLNLFRRFLTTGDQATIDDCVRHVQHVADVMGRRDGVGLGSDMDGGFDRTSLPADLDHPTKLGNLAAALAASGWSDAEVEGFAGANWRRFLRATWTEKNEARPSSSAPPT